MASIRNRRVGIRNVHSKNRGNSRAHSMKVADSNKGGLQLLLAFGIFLVEVLINISPVI